MFWCVCRDSVRRRSFSSRFVPINWSSQTFLRKCAMWLSAIRRVHCSSCRYMGLITSIVTQREIPFIKWALLQVNWNTLNNRLIVSLSRSPLQQVFVFNRRNYLHIKERLKSRGVLSLSRSDLYNFFAPWFAEHLGTVRCSSGNSTVERWATRKLKLSYYLFTYNSLLKIHGSSTLLKSVDELLHNEAILQLELKSLETAFKDPEKKSWFKVILDNTLKLWDTNMSWERESETVWRNQVPPSTREVLGAKNILRRSTPQGWEWFCFCERDKTKEQNCTSWAQLPGLIMKNFYNWTIFFFSHLW